MSLSIYLIQSDGKLVEMMTRRLVAETQDTDMGSRVRGRNVGRKYSSYRGYSEDMGITQFQDFLFEINDLPERQLTDEELSAALHEEHPTGRRISPDYREPVSVRTVRRRYNTGSQNHGPARLQSWPYVIENGERIRRDVTRIDVLED